MKDSRSSLDSVRPGESVQVHSISGQDPIAKRLHCLGFWPNTTIDVVRRAPFGDPTEYRLRGFKIALRKDEAKRILILPTEATT